MPTPPTPADTPSHLPDAGTSAPLPDAGTPAHLPGALPRLLSAAATLVCSAAGLALVLALVPTDPSPAAALLSLLACLLGVALLCWPAARVAPLLQGWTSATGATGAVLTGAVAAGRGSPHWLGGAVLVVGVLVGAGLAGYVGVRLRRPALNGA